jgi:hypothetical protein
MSRTSIPVDSDTKSRLDKLKRDNETWDEFLQRTALSDEPIKTGFLCNRPHPTSLGLTTSLVEGGALMWFSSSVGATGRLVRPAYRTPFGVNKPTIWGRATAARTALGLCQHSTIWQYGRAQLNGCFPPCRFPPRPTRSLRSLLEVGGSTSKMLKRGPRQ